MCIIIDANVAHKFLDAENIDASPLRKWLENGRGNIATGGKNKEELVSCSFRTMLRQYILAGRVMEYEAAGLVAAEGRLDRARMESDDPHVLALAVVSGSRLVFTEDQLLHQDFKSGLHFPKPKGKIYQKGSHAKLLKAAPSCRV